MIIIVEVTRAHSTSDKVQIQNFLSGLTRHLILNGHISLIDKDDPFNPINDINNFKILGSNPGAYDIKCRFDPNAKKPSYPLFYSVNVVISPSIHLTKKEVEALISNKSRNAFLDSVRIVKYSFETADRFPQTQNPFFTNRDGHLKELFSKYKLDTEQNIPAIDVVFRRAAAKGNTNDLTILIITRRVDINSQDSTPGKHYTALHWAAKNGHVQACNLLLFNGANPNIKDATNHEPEYYLNNPKPENKASGFDYSRIFN